MKKHYKILIVEDNPIDFELAQREIKHVLEDVEFSNVCTRKDFNDSLNNFKPDIIVTDFSMPDFDGLEVIKLTRKNSHHIPVIVFTGSLDEETAAETVKSGAVDYVLKENTFRLRQAILLAIEKKQMWLEQVVAEQKLRASEEMYRVLFEQAADGILQVDAAGNIIGVNTSGAEMTAYDKTELLKKHLSELFDKDEMKKVPFRFDLLNEGHLIIRERTIKRKDGSSCDVEMHSKMMPDGTYQSILRDITERKLVEKELRKSEERYSNLIQVLPVGVVIHSKGKIILTNNRADSIIEVPPDFTIVGAEIFNFVHPDYRNIAEQRVKKSLAENEQSEAMELVYQTYDGKPIFVEVTSLPIIFRGEHSLLTVFNDISKRKQAEIQLKESEAKYRTIFENTGTATIIIEEDKTISLVNSQFSELSGLPKEDIENKKCWTEFVVAEDLDMMLKMHKLRRTDSSKALHSYEFRFKNTKGEIKNILLYIDMIPGTKKSLASLLDITAIKRATEEIVENEKRFRNIIELANISLSIVAFDGTIEYINQQAVKTFGYEHHDIPTMERWWAQAYPDEKYRKETLDQWMGLVNKAIKENKEIERKEYRVTCKDGSVKTMIIFGVIVNDKVLCMFEDITDRKNAEEELRKSRMLLRTMIDSLPIWISATDLNGNYIIANKFHEKFFKKPLELIEGYNFKDIFNVKDYQKHKDYFDECISSGKSIEVANVLHFENDKTLHVFGTYTPLFDEKGKIFGMAALVMDISMQKEAEIALKESETQFRTTFENAPIGMSLNHINGMFFQVNDAFCKMLGYTQKELQKLDFPKITYPEDIDLSNHFIQKVLVDRGITSHIEKRYVKKDGSVIWAITSASVLRDINDNPKFFIVQVLDITGLKTAEQKLIEAKNQLEIVFDNGPDAILLTRIEDGFYIDSNKTFTKYTGYTPDDLRGKSTLDIDIWDNPKDREILLKEVKTKGFCHNLELVVKNKNGTKRIIDMSAEVIIIKGVPHLLSISRDIAERKKMEELLQKQNDDLHELNATKDRFFSIIAHDLKDPHNAILGFSGILSEGYDSLSDHDRKNYVDNILHSSQSLARLLENLLEWAGSQTGKMVYKPEKLDLNIIIQDTFDLLQYQAKIKQIRLITDINSSSEVYADSNMTKTILRNLVSNAIKFTHRNGYVKISTANTEDKKTKKSVVEISVTDNGIGIKKENLTKLLRLDQNIKTPGTEDESGSGLGLILCKELVEKNNGALTITSEENIGTTISFTLPKKIVDK